MTGKVVGFSLVCFCCSCLFLLAAEPSNNPSPLRSKTITLVGSDLPLSKALESIRQQSGTAIVSDLDATPTIPNIRLNRVGFWQAADSVARAVKARTSLSSRDGSVHLIRSEPGERDAPVSYQGPFRVRLVRVSSTRDLTSDQAQCVCTLELVWTASLRPLFVDEKIARLQVRDVRDHLVETRQEASGLTAVDGRFSYTADLTLDAFPRTDAAIKDLQGQFVVVAPSEFLTFRFEGDLPTLRDAVPGGALRRLVQSDVVCRIDRLFLARDRWTVVIGLEYPAGGGGKALESYQASSLVLQNELRLSSAEGKRTLAPSSYVIDSVSSRRAQVSYHFTDQPRSRRGQPQQWKVTYQAPERLIHVPVAFKFKNIPLP